MARKRFTDADKWEDPWFCEQSMAVKLFWSYILDRCDQAGVWQVNWRLAKFQVGDINPDEMVQALGDRVVPFDGGRKWFIPKFLVFQYPTGLTPDCHPHRRIILMLVAHGIDPVTRVVLSLKTTVNTTPEEEDEEEDKDSISGDPRGADLFAVPAAAVTHPRPGPLARSFSDWLMMHGRVFVGRDDRADWEALYRHAGWEPLSQAHAAILPTLQPNKSMFFTQVRDYIVSHFEEVPDGSSPQG